MPRLLSLILALALLLTASLSACSPYKTSGGDAAAPRAQLHADADAAVSRFKSRDPSMQKFFDSAVAYAIFPSVGKAGFVIGGSHGLGELREHNIVTGYATISQATVGAQIGAQAYSEIIFFRDRANLQDFKDSRLEFAAQASAIAASAGASADADYHNGVAIFTIPVGGLMAEASVGGQKFSFEAK